MKLRKIILLINTVKYLKFSQIFYRIYRKFPILSFKYKFTLKDILSSESWIDATLYEESISEGFQATFLNSRKKLNLPFDWNNKSLPKLWLYNLHYFEDFVAERRKEKTEFHIAFFNAWIQGNEFGKGNGWEAYPTSLRLCNLLKAKLGGLPLTISQIESIKIQVNHLANHLEKHLLGNHYFVNLKALLFAGVLFQNEDLKKLAINELKFQIREQILEDGGNFELTPMYHNLILVDMLDMLNLCRAYPHQIDDSFKELLSIKIPSMLKYMVVMSHPDSGVSFFNDSVDGIAPKQCKIIRYAELLGINIEEFNTEDANIYDLKESGYMVATSHKAKVIFDAANVGPDYMPGHAHADTLSLEFSILDQRVIVNSGISEYGIGPKRNLQRATSSHSTVELDGENSSQVWGGFRVGNRASIIDRESKISINEDIILNASHNGYSTLLSKRVVKRQICLNRYNLKIVDSIEGKFKSATSRIYFHPNVKVSKIDGGLEIKGTGFQGNVTIKFGSINLIDSEYHPEFGQSLKNQCLVIDLEGRESEIQFNWTHN